jgi:DNA-binding transcriptional LysR family regulator
VRPSPTPRGSRGPSLSRLRLPSQHDVWRFRNKAGEAATVTPIGPLRARNVDALIPTLLARLPIAELPEFIAFDLLRTSQLEALLPNWSMPLGGLYFVTPTARARGAKVEPLSSFLTRRLSRLDWQVDSSEGRPTSGRA